MANETIMQGLLESLMQRPQDTAQQRGTVLANLISQPNPLAATVAYMMPGQLENVAGAARGLFGLKAPETFQTLVAQNPSLVQSSAGLTEAARRLQAAGDTNGAARLALLAQERLRTEQVEALNTRKTEADIALSQAQASDVASRAATNAEQLRLEADKLKIQQESQALDAQLTQARIQEIMGGIKSPEEKALDLQLMQAQMNKLNAEAASMPDELAIRLRTIANQEAQTRLAAQQEERLANAMSAQDKKEVYAATREARVQQQSALSILNLATRYAANPPTAGVFGNVTSAVKSFLGQQGDEDTIRQDFSRIVNSGVLQSLPKGAASDKDMEIASRGFPTQFTSQENAEAFMRGAAKTAVLASEMENARAAYILQNKNDVGFMEAWQAKVNTPGFIEQINAKYRLTGNAAINTVIQASDEDFRNTVTPGVPRNG